MVKIQNQECRGKWQLRQTSRVDDVCDWSVMRALASKSSKKVASPENPGSYLLSVPGANCKPQAQIERSTSPLAVQPFIDFWSTDFKEVPDSDRCFSSHRWPGHHHQDASLRVKRGARDRKAKTQFPPMQLITARLKPALTTIFNSLAPGEQELWTFYNNSVGDLELRQRQNPTNPTELLYQKALTQTGNIKNPSSMVNVYGVVTVNVGSGPGATTQTVLKRLSPTVEPLPYNILIKKVAVVVSEYALGSNSAPKKLQDSPLENTYLAASSYKPAGKKESRRLFYQKKDDDDVWIRMMSINTKDIKQLPATDIAKPVTLLAACTAPSSKGVDTTYVCFSDLQGHVWRVMVAAEPDEDAKRVDDAPRMASWSQIAVTPGATCNYLSYVPDDGDKQTLTIFADERR
ncbi:hypothetical protein B0T22DRAFT_437367 [Podospora appendiculata]|uniref:Uncharacterized protein n=1 Tax=Podospora appendiculata TaxID=314037 RepID=A0AAE0XJ84_9PEZI|nr:hypothetical protein B0T22DRAFT_437367 [Podospora appendiculata]